MHNFRLVFGSRMPRVRVSPLGPKCYKSLLRFIAFFVCIGWDSNDWMQRGRALPPTVWWRRTLIFISFWKWKCKRVSPLGPKSRDGFCHPCFFLFLWWCSKTNAMRMSAVYDSFSEPILNIHFLKEKFVMHYVNTRISLMHPLSFFIDSYHYIIIIQSVFK